MKLLILCLLIVFLGSCSSTDRYGYSKLDWEDKARCGHIHNTKRSAHCNYTPKKGEKPLFEGAKVGLKYRGYKYNKGMSGILPRYKTLYVSGGIAFVKNHGDEFYSLLNMKTRKETKTKVVNIAINKFSVNPKIEMNPDYVDGSVNIRALFNKDYSEIYYYSSEGELLNTAKNVYNADPVKSPALIRGDRFVKHKVGDRMYAQMYTWRGEKIGPEIEFSKLFHFHMITMTGNRSSYYRGYFESMGDYIYKPINSFSDGYLDSWNNPYNFLGVRVRQLSNRKNSYKPDAFVYKDKDGLYFAPVDDRFYSFNSLKKSNEQIKKLYENKKNHYINKVLLPSGSFYNGKFYRGNVKVFEKRDGTYLAENVVYKTMGDVESFYKSRMKKRVAKFKAELQKQKIAAQKKAAIDKKYAGTVARAKARAAQRRKREGKLAQKVKQQEANAKLRTPTFDIDVDKIFDTAGAKRRSACHQKITKSIKAQNSGKQNWRYTGKCK